jgi:multiple sugar transport system permease protein
MTERNAAWLFLAPALIAIGLFFVVPVVSALLLSVTDFDIYALADLRAVRFVGLGNYATLLKTPLFWTALANTFYFVFLGVPLAMATALGAALLLDHKLARFKSFYRTVLFAPVVTTVVASAVVWKYLLHPRYGMVNYALGLLHLPQPDWLADPAWAMPAIVVFSVWKGFGYNMIILLAALQTAPEELYEAARLDGAGPWARFRHVTLPAITPALLLVAVLTAANYFQLFAEPYVMTEGGPAQRTVTVLYFMFEQGFKWWSLGFASAVAFVLFAIMLAVAGVQALVQRMRGAT